jgi:hypothetical protein
MSRGKATGMLAILVALGAVVPTSAHHALQAVFDVNKSIAIKGTIVKVEWINPHAMITIEREAKGKTERWAWEFGATGVLNQAGMSRADRGGLKAGDPVTIEGFPARNGRAFGFVQKLHFPDGRVFVFRTNDNGQ